MELMIDIETLGIGCNSAFASIGWCAFYRDGEPGTFAAAETIQVDPQSCLDAGMRADWSTIVWWFEQEKAARREMLKPGKSLRKALEELSGVCREHDISQVWCRGQDFDLAILRTAYRACRLDLPWKFWMGRDVRTALEVLGMRVLPDRDPKLTTHVAHHDARYQAYCLQMALGR